MNAGTPVLDPSLATCAAILAAPLVGIAVLILRMIGRSGHVGMSLRALWVSKADTSAVLVYDLAGGILCAGGVLLLGVTRPSFVVQGFSSAPVLAWSVVGSMGPLVSAGVIDRLPLRALVDFFARNDEKDGRPQHGSPLVEVRFQASQRILFALYEDVRVREGIARDTHSARVRELVEAGKLRFDDVAREARSFSRAWKREVPPEVAFMLEKRAHWPTGEDPGREVLVLVETLLDLGITRPVAIACRIAEQRPASPRALVPDYA